MRWVLLMGLVACHPASRGQADGCATGEAEGDEDGRAHAEACAPAEPYPGFGWRVLGLALGLRGGRYSDAYEAGWIACYADAYEQAYDDAWWSGDCRLDSGDTGA